MLTYQLYIIGDNWKHQTTPIVPLHKQNINIRPIPETKRGEKISRFYLRKNTLDMCVCVCVYKNNII